MKDILLKSENVRLDSEFLAKAVIRLLKQDVFNKFLKTGTLSKEDQEFCDELGWYPVDELELREEYVEKLKGIEKGQHSPISVEELDKLMAIR